MTIEETYTLKDIIEKNHNEVLTQLVIIKDKVERTSGRVKSLEMWRSFLGGGFAVFILIVTLYEKLIK